MPVYVRVLPSADEPRPDAAKVMVKGIVATLVELSIAIVPRAAEATYFDVGDVMFIVAKVDVVVKVPSLKARPILVLIGAVTPAASDTFALMV